MELVTLEYELAPVVAADVGVRCAFCGRPGEHDLCCETHERLMCEVCREVKGSWGHRDPAELPKEPG
jgi:hypothetical protein